MCNKRKIPSTCGTDLKNESESDLYESILENPQLNRPNVIAGPLSVVRAGRGVGKWGGRGMGGLYKISEDKDQATKQLTSVKRVVDVQLVPVDR